MAGDWRLYRERMGELWDYLTERQKIYHRRHVLNRPWPWTLDPVLRDWHFPNVYRELDPGTVYLREKLLPACGPRQVLLNLVVYRHFNTIEAARRLLPLSGPLPQNTRYFLQGINAYTNAYRTSPFMNMGGPDPIDNSERCSYQWARLLPGLEKELHTYGMTDVVEMLEELEGLGPFTSYLIACDLTYTDLVDYTENAAVFPHTGSIACLSWMVQGSVNQEMARRLIYDMERVAHDELASRGFPFHDDQDLSLRALEDGLCELHRYRSLKAGSSSGRRYYHDMEISC
jgi:hypothetical protein